MTIINKVSNRTLMPGITPIPDVPDAPTIGAVTDSGDGTTATVAYTAAVTGGTVTTFTATSTPGSFTGTGSSPISVTGLTAGTSYTFKVKGTNATATGPESSASSSLTLVTPPAFESIATVAVGSNTPSITFSSIPQTYKHLQIRYLARTDRTGSSDGDYLNMRFNGISSAGSYYGQHYVRGNGTAVYSANDGTYTASFIERFPCATQNSGHYGAGVIDIYDYTNTNKLKVWRNLNGTDWNGSGMVRLASGMLLSAPAISSITISIGAGTNIVANSHFALYGIKG